MNFYGLPKAAHVGGTGSAAATIRVFAEIVPTCATIVPLNTYLTYRGYRVLTASSGQECLDLAHREHPSLIIHGNHLGGRR